MNKYLLHGKFTSHPGKADELENILIQASELLKTSQGCKAYVISRDEANENDIWVTEFWDSKEDHDNSLSVAGVRELIGEAMPLIAIPPTGGQELIIKGGIN